MGFSATHPVTSPARAVNLLTADSLRLLTEAVKISSNSNHWHRAGRHDRHQRC
jgi:hypothetical protein